MQFCNLLSAMLERISPGMVKPSHRIVLILPWISEKLHCKGNLIGLYMINLVFNFFLTKIHSSWFTQGKGNVILTYNSKWKFPLNPFPYFSPSYPLPTSSIKKTSFTPTKYLIFGNFKWNLLSECQPLGLLSTNFSHMP